MSTDDMKQRVQEFWDAFNREGSEAALALVSDDIVFTVTGATPVSGTYSGKDAVRGHFNRFAALVEPGARMRVSELMAEGDTVVCLSDGIMQATRTGREYNNAYAFVFIFKGEEIVSVTEYLDTALVETALFGKSIG